jgi:hypothetical protein
MSEIIDREDLVVGAVYQLKGSSGRDREIYEITQDGTMHYYEDGRSDKNTIDWVVNHYFDYELVSTPSKSVDAYEVY